jgi:hypothetical protein
MPNLEVKRPIADGTAEGICGRVGRRQINYEERESKKLTSSTLSLFVLAADCFADILFPVI